MHAGISGISLVHTFLRPFVVLSDWFPSGLLQVATRLFSGQELSALRRDASFRRQVEEGLVMEVGPSTATTTAGGHGGGRQHEGLGGVAGAEGREGGGGGPKGDPVAGGLKDRDPRRWSEVSWKSVSLARKEKERRERNAREEKEALCVLEPGESDKKCVGVRKTTDSAGGGGTEAKERRRRSLQETEASTMRQHARKREDDFIAGGAQNFYKPVRVCDSCFRVS